MIAKECINGRWRFLLGALITLIIVQITLNNLMRTPTEFPRVTVDIEPLFDVPLAWLAAFFGVRLIASEVSAGTLPFLLSRPLSRERVLLIKYGVSAGLLFAFAVFGEVIYIWSNSIYYDLDYPAWLVMLVFALLDWFGALVFLGIGLTCSILGKSSLSAFVMTLPFLLGSELISVCLAIIGRLSMKPLTLWEKIRYDSEYYWSLNSLFNNYRFTGHPSPPQILLTRLVVAALVLGLALFLFRRKAY